MLKILRKLAPYKKAVAGLLTPGLVALGVALLPTSPGGAAVTQPELGGALAAMLATCGVVFKVKNRGRGRAQVTVDVDTSQAERVLERLRTPVNTRKD